MPWGSAIDIWNLECLVGFTPRRREHFRKLTYEQTWDLFEGQHLFVDIFDAGGHHDLFRHLALMTAVAGPLSKEFVKRSETTEQCFNGDGELNLAGLVSDS